MKRLLLRLSFYTSSRRTTFFVKLIVVLSDEHTRITKRTRRSTKTVRDRKEASYTVTVTVINPKIPKREEYLPTTEDVPKYPESILNDFGNSENFVPLSRNLEFIDYQNAQIILTGAREVRAILTQEL